MYKIKTITSITHQNSFGLPNIADIVKPLENDSELITPDYKAYIPPASLRRMSPVLRMALASAIYCQSQLEENFDAISVGTALGCLKDTEKFLVNIHTGGDVLSPTAFIQSTHNTIGGQISLALKNHAYNMTHTQNSISFEMALIDGMLCCAEGNNNVLVGAADEAIDFLQLLQPKVIKSNLQLTSGATFFVIGHEKEKKGVQIADCKTYTNYNDVVEKITEFLQLNHLKAEDISCAFTSHKFSTDTFQQTILYPIYSGLYYTAAAFAVHFAHDWLQSNEGRFALIVNEQIKGTLGLTLLAKSNEA